MCRQLFQLDHPFIHICEWNIYAFINQSFSHLMVILENLDQRYLLTISFSWQKKRKQKYRLVIWRAGSAEWQITRNVWQQSESFQVLACESTIGIDWLVFGFRLNWQNFARSVEVESFYALMSRIYFLKGRMVAPLYSETMDPYWTIRALRTVNKHWTNIAL